MLPQLSNLNDIKDGHHHADKTLSAEQFEQIVTAILEGKYSWACVLMLRFGGYNPMQYIPYRTYKRLIRDNKIKQSIKQQNFHGNDTPRYPHIRFH
ncbi:HetP family heterocyst commitment protein [Leptolyngbya sp. PL-A3]|nr:MULTISPECIES: HetP family heterocyst commitment protein [unclassified Leptolyngbya]MBD1909727.1 HetP family heterocyst commitment protein [Leptolyngbya sp. FACHB-8]MBD2155993.1 HetP family heterocyst commitment protein [Leptolyngbya sp. FACHB-16]